MYPNNANLLPASSSNLSAQSAEHHLTGVDANLLLPITQPTLLQFYLTYTHTNNFSDLSINVNSLVGEISLSCQTARTSNGDAVNISSANSGTSFLRGVCDHHHQRRENT